ncbi:phosphatase PAP2 family protein [Bradyrhizobium zhanjiangense]|uniref:phosphatase PAP2 family protein n=1 Tax=Bradyrhizobium zhanjiangense TaxID=1325107 RepID=UPI001FDEE2C9|nr:phosphatase PAP2 family protein [Bradyrhizobium zhanjiangense]
MKRQLANNQTTSSVISITPAEAARPPRDRMSKSTSFAPAVALAAAIFGLPLLAARFSGTVSGAWDRDLLLRLNSFAATDSLYVWELANNSLFRGFPIFFSMLALWFAGDDRERRSRMLTGLIAVCLATVLSVWIQFHFVTHIRPLLDPAFPLNVADPRWSLDWDRRDSFPSDTSTLFFALATLILIENRLVGLLCFLWVAVIIALPRIIFGWHYPSDVVGSLVLGPSCVLLFYAIPYPRALFERMLIRLRDHMYIVHALLFIFLSDASMLFVSLQKLGKDLVRLLG